MATGAELILNAVIRIWNELPVLAGDKWPELRRKIVKSLDQLQEARTSEEQSRLVYAMKHDLSRAFPEAGERLAGEIEQLRNEDARGTERGNTKNITPPTGGQPDRPILPLKEAVQKLTVRYLQGRVSDGQEKVEFLTAGKTYQLTLWIGVEQTDPLCVPAPIDLAVLPQGKEHYFLDVLFLATNCEPQKQQICLRLQDPESSSCTVKFDVKAAQREFEAYIVVLYEKRIILQVAQLRGGGERTGGRLR
jgi:hypothetical protein